MQNAYVLVSYRSAFLAASVLCLLPHSQASASTPYPLVTQKSTAIRVRARARVRAGAPVMWHGDFIQAPEHPYECAGVHVETYLDCRMIGAARGC